MLDHAREAATLAQGMTEGELQSNRLLQLGLVRLVETIGEAAAGVPRKNASGILKFPGGT